MTRRPLPTRQQSDAIELAADAAKLAASRLRRIGLVLSDLVHGRWPAGAPNTLGELLDEWSDDLPALDYWLSAEGYVTPGPAASGDPEAIIRHLVAWEGFLGSVGHLIHPETGRILEGYAVRPHEHVH